MVVRVLQICVLLFIYLISPFNMSEEEGQNNQTEHEKNFGGRLKSFIWGTYAIQGKKVSDGHYEATCRYCNIFWHKGSPQALEAHFANDCLKIPLEIKQLFLNRLAEKSEDVMANRQKTN